MSLEIGQRVIAPPAANAAAPAGPAVESKADFKNHLDATECQASQPAANGAAQAAAAAPQTQPAPASNAASPLDSTHKVNRGTVADHQDLFGRFEQVHREFDTYLKKSADMDKLVAEGKLKPQDPRVVQHRREEMRLLLHFQTEMQGAALKVEIASKVVEHGTSGAKTLLSTQA